MSFGPARNLALALAAISFGAGGARAAGDDRSALHLGTDTALMTLHARGVQTYECRAAAGGTLAWTFKAPDADLYQGAERVGHHDAGPVWVYRDGSLIIGKVLAKAAGATAADVPWLRLAVASHAGTGAFDKVGAVMRTNTSGGMLQGACETAGAAKAVPYQADYTFIATP